MTKLAELAVTWDCEPLRAERRPVTPRVSVPMAPVVDAQTALDDARRTEPLL